MAYTNSPLTTVTILSPNNSGQRTHKIDRITPHVMEAQNTAAQCGQYFSNRQVAVSSNYGIGYDGSVGLYVEEENRSWCSSSADNDNRAVTIEVASDMSRPYAVRDAAWEKLIDLCADVCQRNGKSKLIWIDDKQKALAYALKTDEMLLTVHRWFIDTTCPGEWMMERMGTLAELVTKRLNGEGEDLSPGEVEPEQPEPEKPEPEGLQGIELDGLSNGEVIELIAPLFTANQENSGILASISLAQFCLETGYGQTELVQQANNGFGMKTYLSGNTWPGSTWDGESKYVMETQEQNPDGSIYTITASFRKYLNLEASIADHSAYLLGARDEHGNLRYDGIQGCTDYKKAAAIIQNGGYATGVDYAAWLIQIIEMWNLTQYDLPDWKPGISEPVSGLGDMVLYKQLQMALDKLQESVYGMAEAQENAAKLLGDVAKMYRSAASTLAELRDVLSGVTDDD